MPEAVTTIGFDADDTLWQNESFFRLTEARFAALLAEHADAATLTDRLQAAERRNLGAYGFGIKGFVLSMIETALDVTGDDLTASVVREILAAGQEMLRHPIELLPHARAAVETLAESHRIVLVTKGDLLDQERKMAQSGLGELFHAVEIVSEKTPATYARVFARHGDGADRALMVGNSLRSDVIPALEAGAHAVHVPHALTWSWEQADPPPAGDRFHALPDLSGLGALVARLG